MEALIGKGRRYVATVQPPDLPPLEPMSRAGRAPLGVTEASQHPFQRIIHILLRRKELILAMLVLGGLLALAAGLLMRPTYSAMAQIIVDQRPLDAARGPAAAASQAGEEAAIDTHVTVLLSDAHLRRVAAVLLAAHADAVARGLATDHVSWSQHVRDGFSWVWTTLTRPFRRAVNEPPAEAAENALALELKRNLRVSQERRSRIVTVVYSDSDPQRAANITNTIVQTYVDDLAERKRGEAERLVTWLAKRVPEMRQEVARAEEDLESYRLVHGAAVGTGPDETGQQIAQLARQLALAKSDAAGAQERVDQLKRLRQQGVPTATLADVLGSPTLAGLAQREKALASGPVADVQSDQRSQLDEAIARELDRILEQLETENRIYQAQAKSIEDRLQPLKRAATETAAGLSGLRALERQAAASAQLYDGLLRRQQEANEQAQFIQPDARVLAAAWPPERPSSIHPAFLIPPSVIAFGIMGLLLAFGIDRLDHSLRDEDEAVSALGIPCMGTVPRVPQWQAKRIQDLVRRQPQSAFARAIRSLLVSVLPLGAGNRMQKIVLVSSALAGEGKTTLARSLALTAARLQLRVLLLDLGEQTSVLEREIKPAGANSGPSGSDLADVLGRGRPLADAVEHIPELGVDYIPPPRHDGGLVHLLAHPQAALWVEQLREAYDLVIVDGPAAIDRPEASLLAGWADTVLFAVRWRTTSQDSARNALRLIGGAAGYDTDGAPRVASVLTWVDFEQDARFHLKNFRNLLHWRRT
jgi:uncharacterized protein involved in exopolysaccharide biosynthesis/Mrp family chromosome partitioning ATPase